MAGKTAYIYRFVNDNFPEQHDATIEDVFTTNCNVEGYDCSIEILDTSGLEEYQSMIDSWINFAEGYIFVYSIDDSESFDFLKSSLMKLKENKKELFPILIVANKSDLEEYRQVDDKDAQTLCEEYGATFFSCSAQDKINVTESFNSILTKMINANGYYRATVAINKTRSNQELQEVQADYSKDRKKEIEKDSKCFCF